jgi:hypothetical protein
MIFLQASVHQDNIRYKQCIRKKIKLNLLFFGLLSSSAPILSKEESPLVDL